MTSNGEWKEKWDCAEADLEELRMVETPSRDLRFRIVGYLSATVPFKRVMTASRGQLLHWLLTFVEQDQVARTRELEQVTL